MQRLIPLAIYFSLLQCANVSAYAENSLSTTNNINGVSESNQQSSRSAARCNPARIKEPAEMLAASNCSEPSEMYFKSVEEENIRNVTKDIDGISEPNQQSSRAATQCNQARIKELAEMLAASNCSEPSGMYFKSAEKILCDPDA